MKLDEYFSIHSETRSSGWGYIYCGGTTVLRCWSNGEQVTRAVPTAELDEWIPRLTFEALERYVDLALLRLQAYAIDRIRQRFAEAFNWQRMDVEPFDLEVTG